MNELIDRVLDIIDNYRIEDVGLTFKKLDREHIERWVNQFDESDREFLLTELLHILPKSYLSKENTLKIFANEFDILSKDFGYKSIPEFLDETIFLDCQKDNKSQKILLKLIDKILGDNYAYSINKCGSKTIKNWIYIDDVLASGKTFKENIFEEIDKFGIKNFEKSEIKIISSFFILHSWGVANVKFALDQKLGFKLGNRLKFYRVSEIDNNPRIHYYFNPNPKFNHLYPKESDTGKEVLEFIENAFARDYDMSNEAYAFRNPAYPQNEEFYSSDVNRDRYEDIILNKGFDIMKSIDNLGARSLRPLGMTPPGWKTLGTGSHFFTWRNISNTCPLVFWWGTNGWYPLFPVKNRGQR